MTYLDASEWELALKKQGPNALFGPLMRSWRQSNSSEEELRLRPLLWARLHELADQGADPVFVAGRYTSAALFEAVCSGVVEAVELCARAAGSSWPSKVNAPDLSGYYDIARHETCLADCWLGESPRDKSVAIDQRPSVLMAKKLLELGANPEGHPKNPGRPLIKACQFGDLTMAAVLMDAGANPRARGLKGESALASLLARQDDQREMFCALLEAGADPYQLDGKGRSCFDTADEAQLGWINAWLEKEALALSSRALLANGVSKRL